MTDWLVEKQGVSVGVVYPRQKPLPISDHPCIEAEECVWKRTPATLLLSVGTAGLGFVEKADRVLGLCVGGIRALVDGRPSPLFAMCLVTSLLVDGWSDISPGQSSPQKTS